MGSLFKRGKKWYIYYYAPNGKRVREAISPYRETAERVLKKIEVSMAEGKYLDIQKSEPISFKDFAEKFRVRHIRRRNRSARNQEYVLDALIKHFDIQLINEITTDNINTYLEGINSGRAAGTVNKHLSMIKSIFNRANEWGNLRGYNPAREIKKLQEDNERCRYLTQEEQERLLGHCGGVTRLIVLVALKTGLRWSEIINLKWQQSPRSNYVDFENDTIFIHEALAKSKKSRYIPLAPSVKQALMDFPQRSEFIFANPKTGKPIVNLKRPFHAALKEAKIVDFRFHDLRHCFASELVRKGVDLFAVQKLLGHSTPKMTQRYAHLGADHLKEAINILDKQNELQSLPLAPI